MKSIAIVMAIAFAGFAHAQPAALPDNKVEHAHAHQHGPNCGHKAEKHGDHTDYEEVVNGKIHHHHKHADHWDECTGPEGDKKTAKN